MVRATDAAGNISKFSSALNLVVDTAAPATPAAPSFAAGSDTGASSTDGITRVSTPTLVGTAEAGATVTLLDGDTVVGTAQANGNGAYTIKSALLADGQHALRVMATDAAGNSSAASASLPVTIDTTAPASPAAPVLTAGSDTGSSSTDGITKNATPTLTGTAEAGSSVTLLDGTTVVGVAMAGQDGAYAITTSTLGDGSHRLTVKATDVAGNSSKTSAPAIVVIDTAAPAVAIASKGGTMTGATQTVTGTGETGTTITLADNGKAIGTAVTVGSGGSWSEKVTLSSGQNSIVATDTDKAGNAGTSQPVAFQYTPATAMQMSSLHSMVQAMSVMTPSSASAMTPSAPPAAQEHQLAAAH